MKKNANRFGRWGTIGHVPWVLAAVALSGMMSLAWTPCLGQETEGADSAEGADVSAALVRNQAQIAANRKEYESVKLKIYEIRKKHERSEAVAALRAAVQKATEDYEAKKDTDPATLEARKIQRELSAALDALVEQKIKGSAEGAALIQKIADSQEQAAALSLAHDVAELKLTHKDSPITRALAKDKELAALRSAYYKAKSGKARDEARAAYYAARKAAMANMPEAQALIAEIAAAEKGEKAAEKAAREAETQLKAIERRIENDKKDTDLAALRAKYDAAKKAERDAYNGAAMKAARDARTAAYAALSAKIKDLLAADPEAAALDAQYKQLRKDRTALEREARDLRKKAKATPKATPKVTS